MVRACPLCGSRRWRRDNVTGSAVCEDGHVYQDFRVEDQDADGPSQHALQRRKMKTGKRGPKKESGRKNEEYYEGDDAEYLRIQALQILLRTQVQALRKLWDLPDVYEMIVRDLWTYQLSISALPLPPTLPESTQSQSTFGITQSQPATSSNLAGIMSTQTPKQDDRDTSDEDENNGSGDDKEDEEPEVDPELLEEMSQLSDISNKEEDRHNCSAGRGGKGKIRQKRRLKVSDTLVVLSVGLWMIRKGFMCVDIEQIVNGNIIPYLDFAHTTLLPDGMKRHMNRNVRLSLSPIRSPSPKYLFSSIRLFARILQADFGIIVPDINLPLVSWRVISSLGGTPVVYSQVTRLLDLIDLNTSLLETSTSTRTRLARGSRRNSTKSGGPSRPPSRGRSTSRMNIDDEEDDDGEDILAEAAKVVYRRTDRNRDVIMPELAVVAGWIIVMKMAYGLDGYDRRATDADDPVIGMPEGKVWNEDLERRLRYGHLNTQRKELEKHDFTAMSMDDIDRYLNSVEDILLKDTDPPPGCDSATFPLPSRAQVPPILPPITSYRHFHTTQPTVPSTPAPLIPGTGIPPEPGEELRTYDPKDTLGTLPRAYDVVIRSAAEVVGVGIEDLAEVVQLLERRLEKVRKERKVSMRGKWGSGRVKDRSKSRKRNMMDEGEFEADEGSEIEVDDDE